MALMMVKRKINIENDVLFEHALPSIVGDLVKKRFSTKQ